MNNFYPEEIQTACARLAPHIVRTPLLNSPILDSELGSEVFIKAESLQKTGSFKFRGALNMILQLPGSQLKRGVIAYSTGNHGHGVAAAASVAGTSATIVLPNTAPAVKIDNCRWWGAKVITYDPATEKREEIAREYIDSLGLTLIPPFDDYAIIAGQGSIGIEICEQTSSLGKTVDAVVVGCSGGGLSSGVFTAVRNRTPSVECFIVEPEGSAKMARSLEVGTPTQNERESRPIMDALSGRVVGEKTFKILKDQDVKAVTVSDREAVAGVLAGFRHFRLVLEPGGAAALSALITSKVTLQGKRIVVVCSGGNVDSATFASLLAKDVQRGV
jgi:threonine dehydratase